MTCIDHRIAVAYVFEFQIQVRRLVGTAVQSRDEENQYFSWNLGGMGFVSVALCAEARAWLNRSRAAWIENNDAKFFQCTPELFASGVNVLNRFEAQLLQLEEQARQHTRFRGLAENNWETRQRCIDIWKQDMVAFQRSMDRKLRKCIKDNENLSSLALSPETIARSRTSLQILMDYRWIGLSIRTLRRVQAMRPQNASETTAQSEIIGDWHRGVARFTEIRKEFERRKTHFSSIALRLQIADPIDLLQAWDITIDEPLTPVLVELRYLASGQLFAVAKAYRQFCQAEARYLILIGKEFSFDNLCLVENAQNILTLNSRFSSRLSSLSRMLQRTNCDTEREQQATEQLISSAEDTLRLTHKEAMGTVASVSSFLELRDSNVLHPDVCFVRHLFVEDEVYHLTTAAFNTCQQLLQIAHYKALSLGRTAWDPSWQRRLSMCGSNDQTLNDTVREILEGILECLRLIRRAKEIVLELRGLVNICGLPVWCDVITGCGAAAWFRKCRALMMQVLTNTWRLNAPSNLNDNEAKLLLEFVDQTSDQPPIDSVTTLKNIAPSRLTSEIILSVFSHETAFRTLFISEST